MTYDVCDVPISHFTSDALNVLNRLNARRLFLSDGTKLPRDWRGLANLVGITVQDAENKHENMVKWILETWLRNDERAALVHQLFRHLETIDRYDIRDDLQQLAKTKKLVNTDITRVRRRGVLVVFSYIEFRAQLESYRRGVDVDCQMLKHLFLEMGFEVISFQNLTQDETLAQMKNLPLKGAECVFIVISSHGYGRDGSWDTDIRCSDGGLISAHTVVDHFNNQNCPVLRGIPKVFIFQMCRCDNRYLELVSAATDGAPYGAAAMRGWDRVYSDTLIAHYTLPGFVSHRDMDKGSWFIQALCEVFAAHAHDCHVITLFTLVDKELKERFHVQTSVVENWGFNCKLYLHPGLFED